MRFAVILSLLAAPALADARDDAVLAYFKAGFTEACGFAFDETGALTREAQRWDLQMPTTYGDPEAVTLWQFPCSQGAYNTLDLFILSSEFGGIQALSFAAPDLKVITENPDDPESKVTAINISGWRADLSPINPAFDPATQTLTAHGSWRGLDDAFDDSTYALIDGHFRLLRYEADADYDGEQHPVTVYAAP